MRVTRSNSSGQVAPSSPARRRARGRNSRLIAVVVANMAGQEASSRGDLVQTAGEGVEDGQDLRRLGGDHVDVHITVVIGIAPTKAAAEECAANRRVALQPLGEQSDQFGLAHAARRRLEGVVALTVYARAFLAALMARDIAGSGSG